MKSLLSPKGDWTDHAFGLGRSKPQRQQRNTRAFLHPRGRPAGRAHVRARRYRAHRIHLDRAGDHGVSVITAGTLVAEDGETPVGSLFVLEAPNRASIDAFTGSDPYRVHGVWETVDAHYYQQEAVTRGYVEIITQHPRSPKDHGLSPRLRQPYDRCPSCRLAATSKSAESGLVATVTAKDHASRVRGSIPTGIFQHLKMVWIWKWGGLPSVTGQSLQAFT